MGIMDHTRTWHFETNASPADCVGVFADCLGARNGAIMGSRWNIETSGGDDALKAVATYEGRAGVIGAVSMVSARAHLEQAAALGSQMTFTATARADGTTTCTMAMTRVSKMYLFFTADARFFRSAMSRFARQLRNHDAGLRLAKQ